MNDNDRIIEHLVPIVRTVLKTGLNENFMKNCVRIGEVEQRTTGLKSHFVGHVRVDINTIVKTHTKELQLHKKLMEKVNNFSGKPQIFPQVLQVRKISSDSYIMLMEELLKHDSFLKYIYEKSTTNKELEYLIKKALEYLSIIHKTPVNGKDGFTTNTDPYWNRINDKINSVLNADTQLSIMSNNEGIINGKRIKSINDIKNRIHRWISKNKPKDLCLVHGDYHLENILFRRRGSGFSCKTIDPNPLIGFSDPLYDFGKILHWVDIVGWAKYKPDNCNAVFQVKNNTWELNYNLKHEPNSVRMRRKIVNDYVANYIKDKHDNDLIRLNLSLASAHLGFAPILMGNNNLEAGRFVFGRAIGLLNEVFG